MTKTVFYKKVGRRYQPVAEYDSEWVDSYPEGSHLVVCYPGGSSRRFNINPDHAALIAAASCSEDVMSQAIYKATELRPVSKTVTPEQRKAYDKFMKTLPEGERGMLTYGSAGDAARAGIDALIKEHERLMSTHPAVKKAYDHYILMCELAKNHKKV